DTQVRRGVSLGKDWQRICRCDRGFAAVRGEKRRRFESSLRRDAATSTPEARAPRNCGALLRARSSPDANLCVVPGRPDHERGPAVLSWLTNHSPTEMGVSGHVHLFVDETGGAHSSDFAGASAPLW